MNKLPKLCNLRRKPSAFKIDRSSRWGNPFILGPDGTREEVIALYREYAKWRLSVQTDWLEPLRDQIEIGCWCAPLECHGDVLLELLGE